MTMNAMDVWLENRGYDVVRIYRRDTKDYAFTISKDGHALTRYFKYPGGDYIYANQRQKEFIEGMDREFYKQYELGDISGISKCPICGCHPDMTLTVTLDDLLDDDTNKISCCGYTFTARSQEECMRKWNQHVENRNKLMNGFMFNTPLSNSIQKEVELMNNYMANVMNAATAHRESMELFRRKSNPQIKKVHFNKPVTCIIWTDGTKTLVRAQDGETYDPEKGMALAIAKKFLGNKGNYYNVFDKYLSELEKVDCKECPGTDHGKKKYSKNDVEESKYERLMIKDCSIGDEVIIRDGLKRGCTGARNKCGVFTLELNTAGLLEGDPGVNVRIDDTEIWRVNPDCIVERIKKAPGGKKE